uniref:Aldehyde oxidase/xanthine dehydrogenase first molybdopterin binding domain-containing protein n=1 Tax=Amphimedon queenslandica TaxID=400682 RepID=A0A1X7SRR4_AMPQE
LGQFAVAGILGIPENKVTVVIKRVGGAYGSKISRASQVAAACALGSYVTQRPVRLHMDLESNMKMVGKRYPYYAKYTVGCTKAGILNGIKIDVYTDAGCSSNDSYLPYALRNLDNNLQKLLSNHYSTRW